jgi:hypothetical protein
VDVKGVKKLPVALKQMHDVYMPRRIWGFDYEGMGL